MRIGALDISKNRVGIAFSDEDQVFVSYQKTLLTKNKKFFRKQFEDIFKEYKPDLVYVGLPLLNDKQTKTCQFIRTWVYNFKNVID